MDLSDLGKLGDLAKQMQDAYGDGLNAMNMAGEIAGEDMNPDHEIEVKINISAQVEGHPYKASATVIFAIELESIIDAADAPLGDLSSLLSGLGVDLGEDAQAVMGQLGQPRAIGVVKSIKDCQLTLFNDDGPSRAELNKKGTLLATISGESIAMSCESVFSYPTHPDVYAAIPSMDEMQAHLVVPQDNLYEPITFSWQEPENDHLEVSGQLVIRSI